MNYEIMQMNSKTFAGVADEQDHRKGCWIVLRLQGKQRLYCPCWMRNRLIEFIEDFDSNSKILSVKAPHIYWPKNWILSFGSSIKILEPEEIKNDIHFEIEKMFQRNKQKWKQVKN